MNLAKYKHNVEVETNDFSAREINIESIETNLTSLLNGAETNKIKELKQNILKSYCSENSLVFFSRNKEDTLSKTLKKISENPSGYINEIQQKANNVLNACGVTENSTEEEIDAAAVRIAEDFMNVLKGGTTNNAATNLLLDALKEEESFDSVLGNAAVENNNGGNSSTGINAISIANSDNSGSTGNTGSNSTGTNSSGSTISNNGGNSPTGIHAISPSSNSGSSSGSGESGSGEGGSSSESGGNSGEGNNKKTSNQNANPKGLRGDIYKHIKGIKDDTTSIKYATYISQDIAKYFTTGVMHIAVHTGGKAVIGAGTSVALLATAKLASCISTIQSGCRSNDFMTQAKKVATGIVDLISAGTITSLVVGTMTSGNAVIPFAGNGKQSSIKYSSYKAIVLAAVIVAYTTLLAGGMAATAAMSMDKFNAAISPLGAKDGNDLFAKLIAIAVKSTLAITIAQTSESVAGSTGTGVLVPFGP